MANFLIFYYSLCIILCNIHLVSGCSAECCENLILTPYIKKGSFDLARSLAKVDPGEFLGIESYSAFITVKEKYDSNMFFWYFPHKFSKQVPWVIWLQGGPGYSSLFALFDGMGPLKIQNGEVKLQEITWASDYSLLFVDNPVGAGFSYTQDERGYTTNEDDVGEQLLQFLSQFLQVFPELRAAPLFLAGSSYAGKYVPAFGAYIHKWKMQNEVNFRVYLYINHTLGKGVAIGNGLIDPISQMTEGYSGLVGALGLIEGEDLGTLKMMETECVEDIKRGKMVEAANKFNESIEFIKSRSGVPIYNFESEPSSKPYPLEAFVTSRAVRSLIHVGCVPFNFNNQLVYQAMLPDIMNSTKPFLEELLENYGVLSYIGQQDVILPYAMARPMYARLRWSRRKEYDAEPRTRVWSPTTGNVVAYRKAGGNFVDVLIRHAGHMATTEQPEVCKYIVDNFFEEFK